MREASGQRLTGEDREELKFKIPKQVIELSVVLTS